jgi:hypothetical protein
MIAPCKLGDVGEGRGLGHAISVKRVMTKSSCRCIPWIRHEVGLEQGSGEGFCRVEES